MSRDNPLWGQERIANELLLKSGLRVSPRTVRKYMVPRPRGGRHRYDGQRWSTFLHNHAPHVLAADFFTVVTAKKREDRGKAGSRRSSSRVRASSGAQLTDKIQTRPSFCGAQGVACPCYAASNAVAARRSAVSKPSVKRS